jgi:hypothetical protein
MSKDHKHNIEIKIICVFENFEWQCVKLRQSLNKQFERVKKAHFSHINNLMKEMC